MPEVVGQGDGLAKVFVQEESPAQSSGMLGHFESVGEPRPVKIPFDDAENLGLVLQVLEVFAVKNPVAVPLETGAVIILFGAMQGPADGAGALHGIIRQLLGFPFLKPLSGLHVASRPLMIPCPGKKAFASPKKALLPLFPMRASAVSVRRSLGHRASLRKRRGENFEGFSRPFLTSAPAFLPGQQENFSACPINMEMILKFLRA
jgi:hypothetical protein